MKPASRVPFVSLCLMLSAILLSTAAVHAQKALAGLRGLGLNCRQRSAASCFGSYADSERYSALIQGTNPSRLRKNTTGVPKGRQRVAQDEILGRFENMIQSRRDD
jgi:hypothetical protein